MTATTFSLLDPRRPCGIIVTLRAVEFNPVELGAAGHTGNKSNMTHHRDSSRACEDEAVNLAMIGQESGSM